MKVGTQIIVGMGCLKDINNRRHLNKSRHVPFFKVDQKCSNSNSNKGNFGPASKNGRPLLNQSEYEIFDNHCQFEVSCKLMAEKARPLL